MKIYLAGGWFTPEQEEEHTRLYNLLMKYENIKVFNPRLAGEIDKNTSNDTMSSILLGNINAIKDANVVLVIYDGKDTGTIWEAGFAYANRKPIIYYAEKLNGKPFNLMLAKTGYFFDSQEKLDDFLNLANVLKDSIPAYKPVYNEYKGDVE